MAIRKRTWTTAKGEQREAWIVDYRDKAGTRCLETFNTKRSATERDAEIKTDMQKGVHIAPSKSRTVAQAATDWLGSLHDLERSTVEQYRQHVRFHLLPFIGDLKLSDVNAQTVRSLEDRLRHERRSRVMVRKVIRSLGTLLADAQERGNVARNAVRELHRNRKRGSKEKRQKVKLEIGVHIPTPQEATAIMRGAKGQWRPLLVTAIFTGLRASELRGLRWKDVNLKAGEIHVRQRADRYNVIGQPKSAAASRTVPFGPMVANALKEWKLASRGGGLVFGNGLGKPESLANIINRGLKPACVAAAVVTNAGEAKYTGMHCLRHFYASWCIDRGLPPKVIQERLGHESITMTFDRYGHLFPKENDPVELAAAEQALFLAT
jgi:integrase